ncbi:MAG: peptidylprolyl isomerase [Candidatus Aenigmatarchaeota archaeon]
MKSLNKMFYIFVFVFLVSLFFLGCKPQGDITPFTKTTQKTESKKEEMKIRGVLLARVNDWRLGVDDFKDYLEAFKKLTKAQYNVDLDINNFEIKREVLNNLVREQILAQVALEQGLDKKEEVLKALRDYRDSLIVKELRDELEKKIEISYAEVKNFYDQNKDRLPQIKKPTEPKVREIVVDSETKAKEIYSRILQGEDFSILARTYSISESKDKGGDLGYLTYNPKEKFDKFWIVLSALDKGEVSSIFKDEKNNRYYIIKVEDIRGGEIRPFSEVEADIREALKLQKLKGEEDKLIDNFKSKGNILEKNEDLLK